MKFVRMFWNFSLFAGGEPSVFIPEYVPFVDKDAEDWAYVGRRRWC